jgi:outer membrane protein TolC
MAFASNALAQAAPVLTVAQAVLEALEQNDRLLGHRDAVEQADLGVRLARTDFRPRVTPNILGSLGQTDVDSQSYRVDVSQRFTTGTEIRLGTGAATAQIPGTAGHASDDIRFYTTDTTLSLSQPLLRGFGRSATRRPLASAEFRRTDAESTARLAEQQVALEVVAAYYRVVAQTAFVGVTRQGLDRARKLRDASEARLDAGLVSQLDVYRAQQLVAQAETQYFDAQSAVEDARDQLRFLMGRESRDGFDVDPAMAPPDASPIDAEAAVALALRERVDVRSRARQIEEAEHQLRFSRNQLLPQVDVSLALTRRETSNALSRSFGLDGYQVATFFTISMPADRTALQIAHQNALIDRTRRRRELATLERQVADEVRRAIRERDRSVRAVASAETSVDIARREVEVADLRFQRGLSNNLDVVAAENGRLAAETRRIQALADAVVARLRLRAVLGIFDPRADVDPGRPVDRPLVPDRP